MAEPPSIDLSSLIHQPTDRRRFLTRAAALGTVLPTAGTLLLGCEQENGARGTADSTRAQRTDSTPPPHGADSVGPSGRHQNRSNDDAAQVGAGALGYTAYDPALPPLLPGRHHKIDMTVKEVPINIAKGVTVQAWTFDGTVPGPIVHIRQGDTVDFTLRNEGTLPHSMDFHAAQVNPKEAFRSAMPGQTVSYSFTPRYAGAFLYHCGTEPVLMHIGSGMYGAIIVDPPRPLPPAREFVLLQSEFYVAEKHGVQRLDYDKMLIGVPQYVAFNGVVNQYQDTPMRVRKGERVRFHVVNAGPTHQCSFHMVGEQFDKVYLGAPPENAIRGVQTFAVAPGGGMIFEVVCDVAGAFPVVNHGFGHGQKGAIGVLVVE